MIRKLALALGGSLLVGCALLGKSEPLEPRYFSPESIEHSATPAPSPSRGLALRIGRVGGGSYLKERIVFRDADHEIGFYDDRRWTERPEIYLLRALERALFEERAVTRSLSSSAPMLSADLIEFEEIRHPNPGVRLRVAYALHGDHTVLRERTITIDRPLPEGDMASQPRRVAIAMGVALHAAVGEMVEDVLTGLIPTPSANTR